MTSNILLINNGRIVAEGNVHQIRDLIDEHPHTVFIRAADPRALARDAARRRWRAQPALRAGRGGRRDGAARCVLRPADRHGGAAAKPGAIEEVTSPDDNLQAVFKYLVKQ